MSVQIRNFLPVAGRLRMGDGIDAINGVPTNGGLVIEAVQVDDVFTQLIYLNQDGALIKQMLPSDTPVLLTPPF